MRELWWLDASGQRPTMSVRWQVIHPRIRAESDECTERPFVFPNVKAVKGNTASPAALVLGSSLMTESRQICRVRHTARTLQGSEPVVFD